MSALRLQGGQTRVGRSEASVVVLEALYEFTQEYLYLKGYAESTVLNYRYAIESLVSVVGNKELTNLSLADILEWRHHVDKQNWDVNAVASYSYKLRLFFRWWSKKVELSIEPDDIAIPKRKLKLPNYLSLEEVKQVYKSCSNIREKLIVSLLFSTGIRVGELCSVRTKDIKGDILLIRGKNGKEREVYLDKLCQQNLMEYLKERKYSSDFLLTGRRGALSISHIQKTIKALSDKTNIGRTITCHTFRHTYATLLLKNDCQLRYIQELLGHSDISTTQIYTHVSNKDLRSAYIASHVTLN